MADPLTESETASLEGRPLTRLWPFVKVLLGFGILSWLLASGNLDLRLLTRLRFGTELAVLVLVSGLSILLNSARWVLLARARESAVPPSELVRVALATNALIYVSPSGAGADAARTIYLARTRGVPLKTAAGISLVDRFIGLQTLLMVAGTAAIFGASGAMRNLIPFLLLGALGLFAIITAVLRRWDPDRAVLLFAAYGISLAGAVANLAVPILGVAALTGTEVTWSGFCASAIVTLVNSVAPTPGGLGAGEGAASKLLNADSAGAEGMLAARMTLIIWTLVFAAVAGFHRAKTQKTTQTEITV